MLPQVIDRSKFYLITLRGISVLAKFLFTTFYFKYSEVAFGEYSLVATTIVLLVFLMGMDFYSYANRAILEPGSHPQKIIFNQFVLYIILYIILLPVVYLIFKLEHFLMHYFWLFYLVLITEHLNLEFYRLMFVFKKPLAANINLFLRNALWVLVAVLFLLVYKRIDIYTVLALWLAGNMAALLFSFAISLTKRQKISLQHFKFDKSWIIKGVYVSLPYILGSLAYKTIEFSDRYLIDFYLGKKAVGIYAFFANMANVLNIVLFTLVISVLYPVMVESIMKQQKHLFRQTYERFKKEIIYYALATGLLLSVFLPVVLIYIGKTAYVSQIYIFGLLLLANMALNWSFLYHFVIYAHKKDWQIFKATAWAAVVNILLNVILIPDWGIAGAAMATLMSFSVLVVLKYKQAKILMIFMNNNSG